MHCFSFRIVRVMISGLKRRPLFVTEYLNLLIPSKDLCAIDLVFGKHF